MRIRGWNAGKLRNFTKGLDLAKGRRCIGPNALNDHYLINLLMKTISSVSGDVIETVFE